MRSHKPTETWGIIKNGKIEKLTYNSKLDAQYNNFENGKVVRVIIILKDSPNAKPE